MKLLSHVQLFATSWAVAYQTPPSIGFSRQEYWSGLPFPSPGDLPDARTWASLVAQMVDGGSYGEPIYLKLFLALEL